MYIHIYTYTYIHLPSSSDETYDRECDDAGEFDMLADSTLESYDNLNRCMFIMHTCMRVCLYVYEIGVYVYKMRTYIHTYMHEYIHTYIQ